MYESVISVPGSASASTATKNGSSTRLRADSPCRRWRHADPPPFGRRHRSESWRVAKSSAMPIGSTTSRAARLRQHRELAFVLMGAVLAAPEVANHPKGEFL